jgi:diaminopimelate epimerase
MEKVFTASSGTIRYLTEAAGKNQRLNPIWQEIEAHATSHHSMLRFTKMNGAGNDFVMVDNRDLDQTLDPGTIARLCDRHRGIGADGLLAVEPARNGADYRMRYYNADGGEAEMCGNGARCFARYAGRLAGKADAVSFETLAGVITARLLDPLVRVEMSPPGELVLGTKISVDGRELIVHIINTGVPHAVVPVESTGKVDVCGLGAAIRFHPHFAPRGTNANFIEVQAPARLAIRTYERGVEGETLACGTGVCAAALVHSALSGAASPVEVRVQGGEILQVGFDRVGAGFQNVTLTGPADFVFEGTISL